MLVDDIGESNSEGCNHQGEGRRLGARGSVGGSGQEEQAKARQSAGEVGSERSDTEKVVLHVRRKRFIKRAF